LTNQFSLPVAAVVLVERERPVRFDRVVREQPRELERHRLLAPRQLLAAVARLTRIERRRVDVGVVDRVHRVERHRCAGLGPDGIDGRGAPAAADDVQAAEHEQRPLDILTGVLGGVQCVGKRHTLDPHADVLRDAQIR
jgi:hypothetical protein